MTAAEIYFCLHIYFFFFGFLTVDGVKYVLYYIIMLHYIILYFLYTLLDKVDPGVKPRVDFFVFSIFMGFLVETAGPREEGLKIRKAKRRAFRGYKGSLWYLL